MHVTEESSSRLITQIKTINNIKITFLEHPHYNTYQGLLFIQEYDLADFDQFKTGPMQEYSLSDIVRASWIKPRNPLAQPLLLTF